MNDDASPAGGTITTGEGAEAESRQQLLLAFLAEHYEPCPSCQYELHGLTGRHCPECGQSLVLRVGLETPNLGAYVTGLIALSATAGFGGLFTLFFVMIALFRGGSRGDMNVLVVFASITVVFGGLIVAWVRCGRRLRRSRPAARRLLAAICCLTPLMALLAVYLALGPP
ncbi:MAG: hypothetical protein HRU76_06755 [Phycisphaeraceae bacterium]|nr:hypothetical protein [Phycisphaerales bacterium]QOJ17291.1 MAG: hypothetical protein HRU76_06755 [Phycisphaeraceae bacterium]